MTRRWKCGICRKPYDTSLKASLCCSAIKTEQKAEKHYEKLREGNIAENERQLREKEQERLEEDA